MDRHHLDTRVQGHESSAGGLGLRHPHPVGGVEDLALEVGEIDDVPIDDADGPDPRRGQVIARRAAEPTGANEQDPRFQQLHLPLDAHLGDRDVPLVAIHICLVESRRHLDRQPVSLPLLEAAGHGGDIGVAEPPEALGRQQRPHTTGAMYDDLRAVVRHRLLDLHLQETARDVLPAGNTPSPVLLGLADIDQHEVLAALAHRTDLGHRDLRHGTLELLQARPPVRCAAGDGGHDAHDGALADHGAQALQGADVVSIDEHVDETANRPSVIADPIVDAVALPIKVVQHVGHGTVCDLDGVPPAGQVPQWRGDSHCACHDWISSSLNRPPRRTHERHELTPSAVTSMIT